MAEENSWWPYFTDGKRKEQKLDPETIKIITEEPMGSESERRTRRLLKLPLDGKKRAYYIFAKAKKGE